ncbi:MAG: 1-deoxy-D-xylulose-5-phosphate reductoisomerase [Planctomycetota bacterium]
MELLAEQIRSLQPRYAAIMKEDLAGRLAELTRGCKTEILAGADAMEQIAADDCVDTVITAVVGAAGLSAAIAAAKAGKSLAIANKEPLVMAGSLICSAARSADAELLPVDSEHAALFQCLHRHHMHEVERLVLTGSGGPFRTRQDLADVSVDEALQHPTWNMGPKITVDSATMMNKALEIIEAHHLFAVEPERIEVLINPQSLVHGLVHFRDGSLLAHLSQADMRGPIQQALTWPEHRPGQLRPVDLVALGQLAFEAPDRHRFPSIDLGYAAARRGGLAPVALNAANECAVQAFLTGQCRFTDIWDRVGTALDACPDVPDPDLESILACDAQVRAQAGHGAPAS